MQGIIFNALGEFVEEAAGLEAWNDVIEKSKVASGGAYTSGATYPDEEIVALATTICDKLSIELSESLRAFGKFLFKFLVERGPIQLKTYTNAQTLLYELESVVHSEVKRVQPDAYTPFFEYTPSDDNRGLLTYRSERKLCVVAEGLIAGAAEYYGQHVEISHTECVHQGNKECKWHLEFS